MRGIWVAAVLVLAGCTHSPEFVHERPELEPVAPVITRSLRLVVTADRSTDERLVRRVKGELLLASSVSLVGATPFDYWVELHVERRAMSRGTNFLIAWPGFIAFAPAWHGFEWPYRVNTLAIIRRADGSELARAARSDRYTAYYTSNVYGVGAGFGWFPPLYSVPAFVTGIVASFVPEERELHREFLTLEGEEWARRVATEVLAAIARDGLAPEAPPSR